MSKAKPLGRNLTKFKKLKIIDELRNKIWVSLKTIPLKPLMIYRWNRFELDRFRIYRNTAGTFFCLYKLIDCKNVFEVIKQLKILNENSGENIYLQVFLSSDLEDYSVDGKQPIINLREHFEIQGKKYNLIVYAVKMER